MRFFAASFALAAAIALPAAMAGAAVPELRADVVDAALGANGAPARQDDRLKVERVTTPQAASRPLWTVRLAGSFPPRDLRYVVRAGGSPIGFGIPGARERSVRVVTDDPAVETEPITVTYGGAPVEAPAPATAAGGRAVARSGSLPHGPYEVRRSGYDLGDEAFKPSHFKGKVELTGNVHYPRGLAGGPFPLVLFLHGNHSSCYRGDSARFEWPCPRGFESIPSYRGYDYIAERLASYGFVVVSVSANGVNVLGESVRSTGMRQRGELLEKHLRLWRRWATAGDGPFGDRFVGKIDFERIGTMGHSRGGEGVVRHALLDRKQAHPFGIDAVLPLAPVDFSHRTLTRVPLAVMLPYCDGDVSDLQGIHYFDRARYAKPGDPAPKHTVTVMGANHNFFNTVWSPGSGYAGAFDDGVRHCDRRLGQAGERRVGAQFVTDFFRRYLGGDDSLDPLWTGAEPPAGLAAGRALVSYHAPDLSDRRLDLDRFELPSELATNDLGGAVSTIAMRHVSWCPDRYRDPCVPGNRSFLDVHVPYVPRSVLGWGDPNASVRLEIPPGQGDVSGFEALQMRVAPNPGYPAGRALPQQDFAVRLEDGTGATATVAASEVGDDALALPSGNRFEAHVILNQVRFPLEAFTGVDLNDVRAVELDFSRTPEGVIDMADVAFTASP